RRLATQLDLFHMQEEAPGLVFWHPRGWALWQQVEQYMRRVYRDNGYQEVRGPQIIDVSLWQKTGHWDNFKENMFTTSSENRDFGFTDIVYKIATRPAKRIGADEIWDKAEKALIAALEKSGVPYTLLPGEGAFYGPKIEYHLKDSIGRSWQCGTMQVDFSMPGLLGAEYVAEDNARRVPAMLHRAIVGSMERFIGILIEHYAGAMPLWLAPVQVIVLNISEGQTDYAK